MINIIMILIAFYTFLCIGTAIKRLLKSRDIEERVASLVAVILFISITISLLVSATN